MFHLDSLCDDREENVVIMPKESVSLFDPGAALYAPHPRGPWMKKDEYEKRYHSPGRYVKLSDRAVVTGVDRENGVVTVSSVPLVPDPRNPTIPDKPPSDSDPYEQFAKPKARNDD